MERVVGRTASQVSIILEFEEGTPTIIDGEPHTPVIPIALRIETPTTKPVRSLDEIDRDGLNPDPTHGAAYYVRAALVQGTREFSVSLDMRSQTVVRSAVPVNRRTFFTDALIEWGAQQYVHTDDVDRRPAIRTKPDGETTR